MKVVVIGGTGLIGSKVVAQLDAQGHQAVPAAPNTGVNTLTGEGLAEVLEGASVVVDVSNSPSFADDAVMEFFRTSTGNLLKAEEEAGVAHHVALSVVGTDRLQASGYFRAKQAQEDLITASSMPYTIIHATQFFEFMKGLADLSTVDGTVRVPPAKFQPMASDDVAAAVARAAVATPVDGMVEIGGPEAVPLEKPLRTALTAAGDPRPIVTDPQAGYSGAPVEESTLLPGPDAELSTTTYAEWLATQQ
ncbi:SDR family oxidoreductase [Streptomyces sp. CNZ748]|uniref:SDR family oxidoreductase n=1 Tax=Streptomyces sp. CNZ748 TaxID=2885160 RepID=UPI001E339CB7|nr:SDR family oxidoreductase [Streptomyces sp. CNZ748]